ncbi:Ig-like domain repeat protein [Mumia sp.]|uniref:Ig-like domain repeat protein n=1 Tax=Mumia sp. TaxID=1965300 RepID=UPI0026160A88|nr:Ig-like domain repeat protein [Mumia sp.]MDD9347723.1 Ig-like domain repeat protein [Mumia sp.]
MSTSRSAIALAVLPTVAAGLVVLPVVTWNETVTVGTTPDPTTYALAAYTAGADDEPSTDPPVDGALAPDGSPAPDPTHAVATAVDSPKLPTEDFRVAGVTWDRGSVDGEVVTYVRTRETSGWTKWYRLDDATDDGPDPGSREAAKARGGTAPLIVGESDAIQVTVATPDGSVPDDVQVDLLDLGTTTTTQQVEPLAAASAATPRPSIKSRAAWGADERIRDRSAPDYGSVQGAVVHHTAGSNSYSRGEVPAVIRAIYAYHTKALKWRDIGYNVVVDKWGQAWEGRWGGLARNVVGAHALNNNSTTFGISVLGNFESAQASSAVVETISRVIAWKFSLNHVIPTGYRTFTTNTGKKVSRTKIVGHRDVGQTACPGRNLYSKMGTIRTRVGALMKNTGITPTITATPAPTAYTVGGNRVDVAITVAASGRVPTGTVQVVDTQRGDVLGQATLASGKASIKLPKLMYAGARRLAVIYSGDAAVAWRQAAPFTVNVTKAATTTAATFDKTSVTSGDQVSARVTVEGANVVPRGTVSILAGSTLLGRATVSRVGDRYAAAATVRLRRDLPGGTHRLVARYDGHYAISGSTAPAATLRVAKGRSSLSHAWVGAPRWRAQPVLRVRAWANGQTPTGTVVVREGARVVGSRALSRGVADVRLTPSRTKRRAFTISYAGSRSLNAAPTARRTVAVAKAKLKVTRKLSDRSARRGQRVVLRVRATAPGFRRVVGRVTVYRGGRVLRSAAMTKKLSGRVVLKMPTSRRGTQRLRVAIRPKGYVLPYRSKAFTLRVR